MNGNDTSNNQSGNRHTIRERMMEAAGPHVPASSFPFRHCMPLQIRFADIDMFGHINNNSYMSMLDSGKLDYFNTVSGDILGCDDIRAVVVNINCDFLAPTYLNEPIEVWTTTLRVGDRSFTIEQRIINTDTGEQKCRAVTTLCGFDPASGQGAPLNPRWIEDLERYEQRTLHKSPHK